MEAVLNFKTVPTQECRQQLVIQIVLKITLQNVT